MLKRSFDLIIGTLLLVMLAPVMVLIALWVRLDSNGPALFRQRRVGRNGIPFTICKFRTMVAASDGDLITATHDRRITRAGRVLRHWKMDELPQLLNVIGGSMSFVGPRPEVPEYVEYWGDMRDTILSVRPGITDPASLAYRRESEMLAMQQDPTGYYINEIAPRKLILNAEYVSRRTMRYDIYLIVRTVRGVLFE